MTDHPTLGALLRDLRKASGLSLRALAADLGITFQALGHYEREDRGDYGPPDRILDAYAALAPERDRGAVRDTLYFLAGKIPPEITAWLLDDRRYGYPGIKEFRARFPLRHPFDLD